MRAILGCLQVIWTCKQLTATLSVILGELLLPVLAEYLNNWFCSRELQTFAIRNQRSVWLLWLTVHTWILMIQVAGKFIPFVNVLVLWKYYANLTQSMPSITNNHNLKKKRSASLIAQLIIRVSTLNIWHRCNSSKLSMEMNQEAQHWEIPLIGKHPQECVGVIEELGE